MKSRLTLLSFPGLGSLGMVQNHCQTGRGSHVRGLLHLSCSALEVLLMEVCWLSLGKMPRLQGRVCRLGGKETTWRAGKFLLLVHPVCAERGNPQQESAG